MPHGRRGRPSIVAAVKVGDRALHELSERGFCVVEGFLTDEELAQARQALWAQFPTPEAYADDPGAHERLVRTQFAGNRRYPWVGWALNRLAFHPDLVDGVERYLGSSDLQLYKAELWAKYAGAVDYDQPQHRDFGNHTIVVPHPDDAQAQLTTFILLSDVTELDGPTMVVPLEHGRHVPMVPDAGEPGWWYSVPRGSFADVEVPVVGPAGTLFVYRTDVFHRGSRFGAPGRARFTVLADYVRRGTPWAGKMAWPDVALSPHWVETMERATVRERDLFGFPRPGDPYWSERTLADVQRRYPALDLTPYAPSA